MVSVLQIHVTQPTGDVLVFLTGQVEFDMKYEIVLDALELQLSVSGALELFSGWTRKVSGLTTAQKYLNVSLLFFSEFLCFFFRKKLKHVARCSKIDAGGWDQR